MGIDASKFARDLKRQFKKKTEEAMASINDKDKLDVGTEAVDAVLDLVSKGISPIAREGKFDSYKGAILGKSISKIAKSLTGERKRRAREKAASAKGRGYPYSVQKKYPNKRERPVNLFLSGKFLSDLKAIALPKGFAIGFFTELSAKKEQGHREGANGQLPRPIIPVGNEQFSPVVYRRIVDAITSLVKRKFK